MTRHQRILIKIRLEYKNLCETVQRVYNNSSVNEEPVEMQQLSKAMWLSETRVGSILTTQAESSTVYSQKVEVLRKWKMGFPSFSLRNLHFPSLAITLFMGSIPKFSHTFVFWDLQKMQSPHSPWNMGITQSPTSTSLTPSPTLSTILHTPQKIINLKIYIIYIYIYS